MKFRLTRAPSWKVWRRYHGTVWGHTIRERWVQAFCVPMFLACTVLVATGWVGVLYFGMFTVFQALVFGVCLGRHYQMMDEVLHREAAWRAMQQEIHQKLMNDGMTSEEADQFVWQMDLQVDRMSRGEPIDPPKE